ncbi:MAG: ribosome maturation factor RimM [Magnetococcales bacterium]|nr:ribosome maturation factor RimM [Magnetococcales bacterium]
MTRPADLDQWATWWLGEDRSEKTEHRVLWCKTHSRGLVVRLEKIDDRDQAAGMAGKSIWVPRYQLPACDQDSYYWTDLVGMDVKDRSGRTLGRVDHLFETGAQDVMVIVGEFGQEVLIPFVADFVDAVDRNQGTIIVNPLPGMV